MSNFWVFEYYLKDMDFYFAMSVFPESYYTPEFENHLWNVPYQIQSDSFENLFFELSYAQS